MSAEENDVKQQIYQIPSNYEDAGGILGGKFTKRNGFDMAIICGPLLFINFKLVFPNFSIQTSLIVLMCTVIPPLALCAFGLGGESLSQMLFAYIRFAKKKRKLSYISFSDETALASQNKGFNFDKFFDDISSGGVKKAMKENAQRQKKPDDEEGSPVTRQPKHVDKKRATEPQSATQMPDTKPHKKTSHSHSNSPRLVGSALREKLIEKLELGDDDDF